MAILSYALYADGAVAEPIVASRGVWTGPIGVRSSAWPSGAGKITGAVGGLDAHRGIDGKAVAMFPLSHRPRVIALRQAAAQEEAQQLPACALLRRDDGGGIEPGGGSVWPGPLPRHAVQGTMDETSRDGR